ncbi:MAG: hypothetical protein IPJ21_14895 [Sterolibacteriaceae bacterium]|nr:hypothetical protein [Sterolibacteriaceae bacterium]MBK9085065.1 hypothetical protein [Sterolibacteriaceae bacterium]
MTSPAPWKYQQNIFGVNNAIVDAEKRILVVNVPASDRPLMATAPSLLAVLARIADRLPEHDELGRLARRAIEHIR